jgi:hypothetical protein
MMQLDRQSRWQSWMRMLAVGPCVPNGTKLIAIGGTTGGTRKDRCPAILLSAQRGDVWLPKGS